MLADKRFHSILNTGRYGIRGMLLYAITWLMPVGISLLTICSFSLAQEADFRWLDDPEGLFSAHGPAPTGQNALSLDGSTVVGRGYLGVSGTEAFRWTEETGMVSLGFLGGSTSDARSASGDGSIIVGLSASDSGGYRAYRWTESTGMEALGNLPHEGGDFSAADGISEDGSIIVGWAKSEKSSGPAPVEAYRWENGVMDGLGFLPGGTNSSSNAVSASGNVIAGVSDSEKSDGVEAFRWTNESGMIGLGDLPGGPFNSQVRGMSSDGSAIVGISASSNSIVEAFLWTAYDGMMGLGISPYDVLDSNSHALAVEMVNGSPVVVGGFSHIGGTGDDDKGAFIWTRTDRMQNIQDILEKEYDLDLNGGRLYDAKGISVSGGRSKFCVEGVQNSVSA